MTWKDMVRKEITDKDIEEFLESEEEDVDWEKSRGFDNTVIRDRDDTFSPTARTTVADMVNEIKDACQQIIQNVGDGRDYKEQTLEKIFELLDEAKMIAINEY
tara:strand:+ start:214 stop:522 length:309 start_codon:yes stop_codon:yes gene_type:complete